MSAGSSRLIDSLILFQILDELEEVPYLTRVRLCNRIIKAVEAVRDRDYQLHRLEWEELNFPFKDLGKESKPVA